MMLLYIIAVALGLILPGCYVIAGLPAFRILQILATNEPGITSGDVHLQPSDFAVVILAVRCGFTIVRRRWIRVDGPLYIALIAYILINLLASLMSGVKFGAGHARHCEIALARQVAELVIVVMLPQFVENLSQARRCVWMIVGTLAIVAAIQFINFFGASHGIMIGEVQGIERGQVRYFGPVGDSVGSVLLLGYLIALCFANFLCAGGFFVAILLTGGFGAMLTSGVGTLAFLAFARRARALRPFVRRWLWLSVAFVMGAVVLGISFGEPLIRPLVDRLRAGSYENSGDQRVVSARLAQAIILDNPIYGVGYMGYEKILDRYGGEKVFNLAKPDGASSNANNQLLQTLSDSGLPGLMSVIVLLCCASRVLLRGAAYQENSFLATYHLAVFLWLLSMIIGNQAAAWLIASHMARLLWVSLGIAVAVNAIARAERLAKRSKTQRVLHVEP